MSDIHAILKQYWGYDQFRSLQEDIITSVLQGHDTLGMLPTGGGKSITFQVPAISMGGLCLVITPLISLMKDQKDHLVERGIKAAAVYMGMSHDEVLEIYERVIDEHYNFLYLSPERLDTKLFQAKLYYMDVRLLVVDEAHCITQWGYDFRPSYLQIAKVRELLKPDVPVLALTATATVEAIADIQRQLHFRPGANVYKASFERPNLTYSVRYVEDILGNIVEMFEGVECGIVYVRSRSRTKELADALKGQGVRADYYHAGLSLSEKQHRQDAWMQGDTQVIVATNAFGMGIDKPNVRLVIHADLPPSPEEYFQEAGRAGRDGKAADAVILVDRNAVSKMEKRLFMQYPDREYIRLVYQKLANFYQIAIGSGCNSLFEFDIVRFCTAFKLWPTDVHYALKLLANAGYIDYDEDPDTHSRIMLRVTKEQLYHFGTTDPQAQRLLQAILRRYTGLFADYVFFKEDDLTFVTQMTRQEIYDKLIYLSRIQIVKYIPARKIPAIVFRTPRLENSEIRINKDIYEERRARQLKRLEAMSEYIRNNRECRLVQLLRYFGEELDHRCGKCDVCNA